LGRCRCIGPLFITASTARANKTCLLEEGETKSSPARGLAFVLPCFIQLSFNAHIVASPSTLACPGTRTIMKTISRLLITCFALSLLAVASPLRAEAEKRIAFVVGNAAYEAGPLATPANDAGLIAQTLQAAGFDVAGARDLDGEALRAAFRDFLDKAQASGPDTVAFVYLAGYGAQLDGENYFVPVDAKIVAAQDVAVEALRVSDYTKRLAGLPLKASFIILDAARASPFAKSGPPLAGGLALADADPNMLVAFNAAPGTAAPAESGSYGAYAQALAEMIREGGLSPTEVFDGVRLRVNEATKGAEVPWDTSRIASPFVFFERAADAPPPAFAADRVNAMQSRPLRDLGAHDAYAAAVERDTLEGYEDFLGAYPSDPLANRVRGLLAARREAITWRKTSLVDTPDAYWSYLDRYPRGPHAADARGRLATLAAAEEPPPSFSPIVYDVPPPPPPEIVYVDRPVLVFSDPVFGFVPPPPIVFLAPPPPYLASFFLLPPPEPVGLFVLPFPVFVPVPVWVNAPAYVAPPPGNVIFNNIHNTVIVNNATNTVVVKNPGGQIVSSAPIKAAVAGAGLGAAAAVAATVALPRSVAKKAAMTGGANPGLPARTPGPGAKPGALPGQPGASPSTRSPAGHALPGANGKPLPGPGEKPVAPTQQKPQPAGPGAAQNPPGMPSPNKPPSAHALPSGQQLPSLPGGHGAPNGAKPGRTLPPGALPPPGPQPPSRSPAGKVPPQNGSHPSGPNGKAAAPGRPTPAIAPKPQQPPLRQQQMQQQHQPPQTSRPSPPQQPNNRPPPQTYRPPPPQQPNNRPPPQTYRPPPSQQPNNRPPPPQPQKQEQHNCGKPGLPPCH
jgi:uncharacterized caspase-like protein